MKFIVKRLKRGNLVIQLEQAETIREISHQTPDDCTFSLLSSISPSARISSSLEVLHESFLFNAYCLNLVQITSWNSVEY